MTTGSINRDTSVRYKCENENSCTNKYVTIVVTLVITSVVITLTRCCYSKAYFIVVLNYNYN